MGCEQRGLVRREFVRDGRAVDQGGLQNELRGIKAGDGGDEQSGGYVRQSCMRRRGNIFLEVRTPESRTAEARRVVPAVGYKMRW